MFQYEEYAGSTAKVQKAVKQLIESIGLEHDGLAECLKDSICHAVNRELGDYLTSCQENAGEHFAAFGVAEVNHWNREFIKVAALLDVEV